MAFPAKDTSIADGLWAKYRRNKNTVNRNKLAVFYMPLIRTAARRVSGKLNGNNTTSTFYAENDLISYGAFGLFQAIDRYDSVQTDVPFGVYALNRIVGSIYDEMRMVSWLPRNQFTDMRRVNAARDYLSSANMPQTDASMAMQLGMTMPEARKLLASTDASTVPITLETSVNENGILTLSGLLVDSHLDPSMVAANTSEHESMVDAISQLHGQEASVIQMYTYENMTMARIGTMMGVTESRVCQIHKKAVAHLRNIMNKKMVVTSKHNLNKRRAYNRV